MADLKDYLPPPYRLTEYANDLDEAEEGVGHYPVYYATDVQAAIDSLVAERDAALTRAAELETEKCSAYRDVVKATWRIVELKQMVKDPSGQALLRRIEVLEAEKETLQEALEVLCRAITPQGVNVPVKASDAVEATLQEHGLRTHVHCSADGKPAIHLAGRTYVFDVER